MSQFPLYGCTKIFAHYRGIWHYGVETMLAVSYNGIKFISLQEKTIVLDLYYAEIENIVLEENHGEYYVIIQLKNLVARQARQKCYMFECIELEDFASLIEVYSPLHASWLKKHPAGSWRKKKVDVNLLIVAIQGFTRQYLGYCVLMSPPLVGGTHLALLGFSIRV